jgi:hypothetical protein
MAKASSSEIAYATVHGSKEHLENGDINHEARHPDSKEHVIKVRTRRGVVMTSSVEHKPIQRVIASAKKAEGEAKARKDKSSANKAAQLAKKRERSAAANNKNTKNK